MLIKQEFEMKLFYSFIILIFGMLPVYSGSVDNSSSITAGYTRTLNRNAVEDSNDAIIYNPAATAYFDEGIYLGLGYKDYKDNVSYTPQGLDPYDSYREAEIIPYLLFGLKFEDSRSCFFSSIYPSSSKGEFVYNDLTGPGSRTKVSADYYTTTMGFSYALFDFLSFSFYLKSVKGGRIYSDSTSNYYVRASADNISPAFSMQLKFNEKMNLCFRYEAKVVFDWEVYEYDGTTDTENWFNADRDYPAAVYIGFGYDALDDLRIEFSLNMYLIRTSDWDGIEQDYDNSFEAGVSAEYSLNKNILLSTGFLYTDSGENFNKTDASPAVCLIPALDSVAIAAGTELKLKNNYSIDIGISKIFYKGQSGYDEFMSSNFDVERDALELAVGFNCNF